MKQIPYIQINALEGIINNEDAIRLFEEQPDKTLTTKHIVEGVNIDIDNTGKMSSRNGFVPLDGGTYHSPYVLGDTCLVVKNGDLCSLATNLSSTVLVAGVGSNRMSYDDNTRDIFYTNDTLIGYIRNKTAYTFPAVSYGISGAATIAFFDATKSNLPAGQLIAYYHQRLMVAKDNVVLYSDPAAFNRMTLHKNFIQMSGDITLLAPVDDGIWIGDDKGIWFIKGDNIKDTQMILRIDGTCKLGSQVKIPSKATDGVKGVEGITWGVVTSVGVAILGQGGQYLMNQKYDVPSCSTAIGSYRKLSTDGGSVIYQYLAVIS